MNRRGFFGAIASLVAGAAYDPEKLLWRPGAKIISIPQQPFPMIPAAFVDSWNRHLAYLEMFDSQFKLYPTLRVGDTIMVRRPGRFVVRDGQIRIEPRIPEHWTFDRDGWRRHRAGA